MGDFEDVVNGAPNSNHGPLIVEAPPPYAPQIFPAPADAESSSLDESSDYGFLAVDSNQRHHVGEADEPNVERQLVEKTAQGSGLQRVCCNYASQNIRDLPVISDCSFNTYGVVGLAACGVEKNDDEQEEEEESILINWDLQSGKLMLPGRLSALSGGFNWALPGVEAGVGGSRGQEGRRSAAVSSGVLLENVFVRQSSEEAAEAQAELHTGVEAGGKVENFFSGWGLVFAMDEQRDGSHQCFGAP